MQLRDKYPGEANSHRNMLQREREHGRRVDPCVRKFHDFLRHVGPKQSRKATLDRINKPDPEYRPDKVRWADIWTQNNNKGDTRVFHSPISGEYYAASRLAKIHKVTPSAIRKRF